MASTSNISARGEIDNAQHMGFTDQDSHDELLDNSADAGATRIRTRLDTSSRTLCVDDDARGMDKQTLKSALCFHNARNASEAIGLRGYGLNAGHINLSDASTITRIFTRVDGGDTLEACMDWPQAIRDNVYNPHVTDLSVARSHEWQTGALNTDHGTVTMIPMTDTHFAKFMDNLPSILDDMGRTYEKYLRNGVIMTVEVDGRVYTPDFSRALNWEDTSAHLRNEIPIEVWRHPVTKEERIYYWHVHGRPIWEDMVRDDPDAPKKVLRDFQETKDAGFVCIGNTKLRSTYNSQWNPTATNASGVRLPYVPGYIQLCRGNRNLRAVPMETPESGDYEKRRIIGASRHSLEFTHEFIQLYDPQVNKNQVILDHIHPGLLALVKKLAKEWAGKVYERYFRPERRVGPANVTNRNLKLAVRMLKTIAASNPDWFDEFSEWAADQTDEEVELDIDSTSVDSPVNIPGV